MTADAWRRSVVMDLPSNESFRAAVEAGMGATAPYASVGTPGTEAGLLNAVGPALLDRQFRVLRLTEQYRSRAAEAMLAIIAADRPRPIEQPQTTLARRNKHRQESSVIRVECRDGSVKGDGE